MRLRSILVLAGLLLGVAVAAAPAASAAGTSYTWIGGSSLPQGDNTSWTDPDNWSPTGVPGNGDSVAIAPPTADVCNAHVSAIPSGLELRSLTLGDAEINGSLCDASLQDGSLSVSGTFAWHTGVISTPITLLSTATGTISPTVDAASELDADLTVQGRLDLDGNVGGTPDRSLVLSAGTTITVASGATLDATGGNHVSSLSCCVNPSRVVNDGTIVAHSELAFDYVELDQNSVLDADGAGTEITSWAAPTSAAEGARYTGGGTYRVSGASILDNLTGTQTVDAGTTFVLGGGTEPYVSPAVPADGNEELAGTFTIAGRGTFGWIGGHITGQATIASSGGAVIGDNTESKYVDGPANTAGSVTLDVPTTVAGGTVDSPNYLNLYDESSLTFAGRTQIGAGVAIEHGNPVNTGQLTVTATAKNPTSIVAAGLVNRGTLDLAGGVLQVDNDVLQKSGSLTVAGSARLIEVGSSSVLRVQGGQLRGTGSIAGTVAVTGGRVAPGSGGHHIGTLAITGDYSQSGRGTTALDEGRRSGDLIRVSGQAQLGGTVEVDNAFRPMSSTTRTVLTAHAPAGRPACIITTGTGATGRGARHWVTALVRNRLTIRSAAGRRSSC